MKTSSSHQIRIAVAILWIVGGTGIVWAKPQHKESLSRYYGEHLDAALKRCATCHVVPDGVSDKDFAESAGEWNVFGERLAELGETLAKENKPDDIASRLQLVAMEDADGDGVANELELLAGTLPSDAGQKPAPAQIELALLAQSKLRTEYRWQAWRTVERPAVPAADPKWIRNPIDAFVADEHAKHGLTPRPEAPRHVLLRRVYLDLIGLPPTAAEVQAFLADSSPDAYEQVVDRLLEDPRYGQRWGRHWMDVWRYSDWTGWGQQVRDSKPHIWRWRDWIIDAQNSDKPYDRQIAEMLAADELCPEDTDALRATGFLVRNFKLLSREQWMQDTVNHTTKAFLGLTLDCARCHDHMYDAVSQEEYYRFRAIFEPHNVRTDRVPGEPNVEKDGLVRVFDAELGAATYFYPRGDERQVDKQRPMTPGVPAKLGGPTYSPQEIVLPELARIPDKRAFVADDDIRAAEVAVDLARKLEVQATENVAKSEGAALEEAQRQLNRVQLDLALAEAKHAALVATVNVERLEEAGVKEKDLAAWENAARDAVAAQRRENLAVKNKEKAAAENALAKATAALNAAQQKLTADSSDKAKAELDKAKKAVADADSKLAAANEAAMKAEQESAAPLTTEYKKRALQTYPEKSTGRRLALARWLGDPQNPLTARVAVNQIWMRHMGQPLVSSVFDFGNNGQPPTHPALLDWLAAELMQPSLQLNSGPSGRTWQTATSPATAWTFKHMHRLIVTSSTYRMASTPDESSLAIDPDNEFLWRFAPRRMEAELVRDCVLYVAGQLDVSMSGPDIDHEHGLKIPKRSLYFRHAPEKQMTFLRLFDAASPGECYRRKESIIPQQALAMVNSSLAIEQARRIARKLHGQHAGAAEFIQAAFVEVLARPADLAEVDACAAFLAEQHELLDRNVERLTAVASDAADVSKPSADRATRARENLLLVLLNHNDFVTIH